ncbi:hypothetical protein [Moraxella phage Mcat5]|nr:hypothetical protein [Moraxella phage Mcat5]
MSDKRPPLNFDYIQTQATGHYVSRIFPAVGIKLHGNGKKHQPCPLCGGTDRFRCDDKDGTGSWICNQCGAGTGYTLVRDYTKKDAYETHALMADILGIDGGRQISEVTNKHGQKPKPNAYPPKNKPKNKHGKPLPKPPKTALTPPRPPTPTPILPKKAYARTVLG